ncbi:MAG: hypothetical protein H5U08_05215 [Thermogutta sp.]|uniref:hypothetical protein n=1 Tax=Thermogutta sp. TaxID=1962930 RepID=UPI0019CB0B9B|nr:hypothetical protein [Thermogutta sp.]MBC7351740.1 hypothetical protein [Thermogutta sp.]
MAKHRGFNADRFLDKFQRFEQLLRDFVRLWEGRVDLEPATLDVPAMKRWLVEGTGQAKDELVEALYQVYDLCTARGHEDLIAAIAEEPSYAPDPDGRLPVECLALKVRTEREDVFFLAYDRYSLWRAERFSIYKGFAPRPIRDLRAAARSFQEKLAAVFKDHKHSDRVLLRWYEEGSYVNFIVYHEKRTRATLVFRGSKGRLKVEPHIYRPARQDFISYNAETGQVEIEAGYESEEAKLRRCFAEACLGEAEFFEHPEAAQRLWLGVLAEPYFEPVCPEAVRASLVELQFALAQSHGPVFTVRSKDVLRTLELNGLRRKLVPELITRAAFKITFPDDRRGKRVEISGPNKVKFNRTTHAEEVFALLADWGILVDEQVAVESCAVSSEPVPVADHPAGGNGRFSHLAASGTGTLRRPR